MGGGYEKPVQVSSARVLRGRRILTAVVLVVAFAGGIGWWAVQRAPSPRSQAVSGLSGLGAPLPGLAPVGRPVVTRPSCDIYAYCVSASFTWRAGASHRTLAWVLQSVKSWAARNHLGRPVWTCGPRTGLFGSENHPGCEAGFVPASPSSSSVFVAITLANPSVVGFDPATTGANQLPATSLPVDDAVLASVSAQVVEGVHALE